MLEEVSFLRHLVREGKIGRLPLDDALRRQALAKGRGQVVPLGELLVEAGQLGLVEMQDLLRRVRDRGSVEVELQQLRQGRAAAAAGGARRASSASAPGEQAPVPKRPSRSGAGSAGDSAGRTKRPDTGTLVMEGDGSGFVIDLAASPPGSSTMLDGSSPALLEIKQKQTFGPYDILGRIAQGGMGIVYRARQREQGRVVALKVLKSGTDATADQVTRFQREAQAVARLKHPGIVEVYDVGRYEGVPFYAMEYVEGDTLEKRIAVGGMMESTALGVVKEVAEAVHYAHTEGVVHRDLKPSNVLLDKNDFPKIADFGLAKNLDGLDGSTMTKTGAIVGTIHYMSPEQARGESKDVDPRSDIYSLGVMLYELLTGQLPFQSDTTMDVLHQIIHEDPTPPRRLRADISADVQTICLKAMGKLPVERYPTARELAEDIARFLRGEPIAARPPGPWGRARKLLRKYRALTGTIAAAAAVIAGLVVLIDVLQARNRRVEREREQQVARAQELEQRRQFAEARVLEASLWLERGAPDKAIALLDEAIARLPDDFRAFYDRALAHIARGERDAAIGDLNEALRLKPQNLQALLRRAGLQEELGRPAEALRDYEAIIGINPGFTSALIQAASLLIDLARAAEAETYAERAVESDPESPWGFVLRARAKLARDPKLAPLARSDLDHALTLAAEDPEICLQRALFFLSLEQPDEALVDLNRALALKDDHVKALLLRAELFERRGEGERALEDLRIVVEIRPKDLERRRRTARLELDLGQGAAAVGSCLQHTRLAPEDAAGWLLLGECLALQGQPERAHAAYRRAQQLDPDRAEAAVGAVGALLEVQGPRAVRSQIEELRRRFPADAAAGHLAVEGRLASEDARGGLEILEGLAVPADPGERRIREGLRGRLLAALDDPRARAVLEPLARVEPGAETRPGSWLRRARALYDRGQADAALALAEGAARLDPSCSQAPRLAGRIHEDHDRPEQAASCYDRAVAANPYDVEALTMSARVAIRRQQFDRARERTEKARALAPEDATAMHLLAFLELRADRPREALTLIDAAILRDDGRPLFHRERARILAKLGRGDEAEAADLRYRELANSQVDTKALLRDAVQAGQRGQIEEAKTLFRRVLQQAPQWAEAHFEYSQVIIKDKVSITEGLYHYGRAIELHPPYLDHFYKAIHEFMRAAPDAMVQVITVQVMEVYPDKPSAQLIVALIALARAEPGDHETFRSTVSLLDRALKVNPRFAAALLARAICQLRLRDMEAAQADLDAAAREAPQDVGVLCFYQAALEAQRGNLRLALKRLEEAKRLAFRRQKEFLEDSLFDPIREYREFRRFRDELP